MRKISKSRTEDDVVSSTNGSVVNEEPVDTTNEPTLNDSEEKEMSEDVEADRSSLTHSDIAPKKNSQKGKSKKKKSKVEKEDDVEEEYEVDKVVDSKKIKGKLHYLIRWKGYSADSDTWEPENTLSCPELISKFHDEKENSKNKESKSSKKKNLKRKSTKKETKTSKRPKTNWDSEKADENAEYEVDRILEVHHKKNGNREFLIHWKGWSSKFDSWEPENHLNCPDLIKKFMEKVGAARATETRNLRVAPETTNRFTLQAPSSGRRLSKRCGQRQRVRYDNAE
ncbi:chromobox protein homolog 5-like [Plodia interpunctella]|uniref:chromobox protein homolog 5-like n=1 Tax=Plodia interpunctella TaxID=58824 RepID=UPI002367C508|nr:chromobox protein homolog 5-like [Plodia interpunctella]